MSRYLVTGASGFIGRHLVESLVADEHTVRCLVRSQSSTSHLNHPRIELAYGDLEDHEALSRACADVDVVFHLAGLTHAVSASRLDQINGQGTAAVGRACAAQSRPPRVVYCSSLSAAGPGPTRDAIRVESDPPQPISSYGKSKRLGEIELAKLADKLDVIVLRPGIVYGPWDPGIEMMIDPIERLRLHVVVGTKTPRVSLVYVDDMVQALRAAAERGETLSADHQGAPVGQGCYFICNDAFYPTYAELGRHIADALDRRVLVWPVWRWVGKSIAAGSESMNSLRGKSSLLNRDKVGEACAPSWACGASKAKRDLGFNPSYSLDAGLHATVDWRRGER